MQPPPKLRMAAVVVVAPAAVQWSLLSPPAAAGAVALVKKMKMVVVMALVEIVIEGLVEAVPLADSTTAATAVIRPFWGPVTKGSRSYSRLE
jgi:hypothetical protein